VREEAILSYVIVFVIVFGVSIVAYYALNLLVMAGFAATGLDFWGTTLTDENISKNVQR